MLRRSLLAVVASLVISVAARADDLGPQSTGADFAVATVEARADYAARLAKAMVEDDDAVADRVMLATALLACLQKTIGKNPAPALARERLPFIAIACLGAVR